MDAVIELMLANLVLWIVTSLLSSGTVDIFRLQLALSVALHDDSDDGVDPETSSSTAIYYRMATSLSHEENWFPSRQMVSSCKHSTPERQH